MILDDNNMARLIIRCLTPEVYIPLGIVGRSATILVRVAVTIEDLYRDVLSCAALILLFHCRQHGVVIDQG